MANALVSKRLQYLKDSAHLLKPVSPAVSAYMMSQFYKLSFDNEIEVSNTQQRGVCAACGNIFIPGWTGDISRSVRDDSRRLRQAGNHDKDSSKPIGHQVEGTIAHEAAIVFACHMCNQETRQVFERGSRIPVLSTHAQSHNATVEEGSSLSPKIPGKNISKSTIANTSSRRRAKARKQGGLRALLLQKQHPSPKDPADGFGLDLMDILKPE